MKERPILFSGDMVRAILDGRKTQTRRICKDQPHEGSGMVWWPDGKGTDTGTGGGAPGIYLDRCPFGQPGDLLWVRENGWERPERTAHMMREGADTWQPYYYDADGYDNDSDKAQLNEWGFKRRPSIHMPRWASRITLEITSVRVERLQDISESDANKEGCNEPSRDQEWTQCRRWFMNLWESINGPGSWDVNPWVWVIEFKRVEK